ncbi:MAG: extracellular solute-binding protein [Anaerolineae bacterium]|jgi:maltose-binding protein MalE
MRSEQRWSRRQFLGATSLMAAGTMLAACTPKATESPDAQPAQAEGQAPAPAGTSITIQYWVFWNQLAACEEAWRATDEWKEIESNNITLEFKTGAGGDAGRTAVAAGTPCDVGDLGPQRDFMIGGKLLPLEDFISASSKVSEDMFFEGNWADGVYEGTVYGVPAHECFVRRGLNYNARMVEEAGLDPDDPPTTWSELFTWHEKLTKFDSAGNLVQFGIDPYDAEGGTGPGGDGFALGDAWDFTWFDSETGTFNVNHERMIEALEVMSEFYRHMGPDNLQGLRSVEGQGTWGGAYNAEVQAMILEGYWHPGETLHEKPEVSQYNRATWWPMPDFRKGDKIQFYGGHVTSLFKDGPQALNAFPVIEFLQSKAACDIIFDTIGWLSGLKDYVKGIDGSKFPGLDFYIRSAEEATHKYQSAHCPIQSFASQKFVEYREQVYRDAMTAKEAAERWQKDLEDEWIEAGFA